MTRQTWLVSLPNRPTTAQWKERYHLTDKQIVSLSSVFRTEVLSKMIQKEQSLRSPYTLDFVWACMAPIGTASFYKRVRQRLHWNTTRKEQVLEVMRYCYPQDRESSDALMICIQEWLASPGKVLLSAEKDPKLKDRAGMAPATADELALDYCALLTFARVFDGTIRRTWPSSRGWGFLQTYVYGGDFMFDHSYSLNLNNDRRLQPSSFFGSPYVTRCPLRIWRPKIGIHCGFVLLRVCIPSASETDEVKDFYLPCKSILHALQLWILVVVHLFGGKLEYGESVGDKLAGFVKVDIESTAWRRSDASSKKEEETTDNQKTSSSAVAKVAAASGEMDHSASTLAHSSMAASTAASVSVVEGATVAAAAAAAAEL
jgi:hypothetical protein